ncbi:MAG: methyltransferase [Gemmatimonadetes bacterium]|nr:methyltransferase [Gemmatimonadota bacterium]
MTNYQSNEERTAEYLKRFDREKTLKYLIGESRPVIFDVGANVGSTVDELKAWWPEAVIHCFEPQAECWPDLEQRVARFPVGEVILNRFAAGNTSTDAATFYSHDVTSGQSGFNKINLNSRDSIQLQRMNAAGPQAVHEYEKDLNHERTVKIVRLDDYMRAHAIEHVHLLKIDTQGHEPEVLDGSGARLKDVDVVVTELMFYDYYERSLSFSDIERMLHPAGFRLYDISHISKNPMNGRTDWVDVIYVNERIRASVTPS